MLRAGRVNIIMVLGLASIVALLALLLITRSSPTAVVGNFLTALAKGDVDQLVKLSYYQGDQESLRKQWDFSVKEAGPYMRFTWTIQGSRELDKDHASVNVSWTKDLYNQGYDKKYEVPCVNDKGEWKVDVAAMARDMYPALPR